VVRLLSELSWNTRPAYCPTCDEEFENDLPYIGYVVCPECGRVLANCSKVDFNKPPTLRVNDPN
jgi:predicted RNA-binding Zn-ribbon protein involved in translation (DUF1610 family)